MPIITLDREAKETRVNYYYREWTGGVSGESSNASQLERLDRIISHLTDLPGQHQHDVITLGDANLCAISWNNPDYTATNKELSDKIKQFFINETFTQLVSVFTRSQKIANGTISQSCLDHIATNVPDKFSVPVVSSAGNSDHLAILIIKYSRQLRNEPKTIKKRNYKQFNPISFLTQISQTDFSKVTSCQNPDTAAALFSGIFGSILNQHAPLKVYQTRNNYVPWLSTETKEIMKSRDKAKELATKTGDLDQFE